MTRLLFALYLIEAGLLLVVSPWTSWWSINYFADHFSGVDWIFESDGARLAVVLTGLATALVGVADLHRLLFRRLSRRSIGLGSLRER